MPITLPPSLDCHRHTLEEETAFARSLTPEQRVQILALACQAARHTLHINPKREQLLQMKDPLPASTIAALRRLRILR